LKSFQFEIYIYFMINMYMITKDQFKLISANNFCETQSEVKFFMDQQIKRSINGLNHKTQT